MKRFISIALAFAFTCTLAAHAGTLDDYFNRIQDASWHGDTTALNNLSQELNTAADNNDPETGYAAAYADYRLAAAGQHNPERYRAGIDAALDRAENRLEALAGRDTPYQAESLALLSTVYGLQIAMSPVKGPLLGIKSGMAISRAEKLAPGNPRVQLLKGVGKLYTPALFGGDRVAAINAFNSAISNIPVDRYTAVNWGLDDAYIWRGIALESTGQADDARASFRQALVVAPQHAWAQQLLKNMDKPH